MTERREVWITGVGLLTGLGEGLEKAWEHLERGYPPPYDDKSFAPYIVHQLPAMSFDKQIPKKSDQRQMETWQRVGVYSAGLALTDAGIAGNAELLDHTDMIVAEKARHLVQGLNLPVDLIAHPDGRPRRRPASSCDT